MPNSYFQSQSSIISTPVSVLPASPPAGIIYGGTPAATFKNFAPGAGLWLPCQSVFANQTLTFLPSGAVRVASNIVHTTDKEQRLGVRSRFKVFPDVVTGNLRIHVMMENGAFTPFTPTVSCMGILCEKQVYSTAWDDIGVGGRINNHATSIMFGTQNLGGTTGIEFSGPGVPAGDGWANLGLRIHFTPAGGILNDDLGLTSYDWTQNGGALWTPVIPGTIYSFTWKMIYGLSIFLGLWGSTSEQYQADIIEFKVIEGYAAFV